MKKNQAKISVTIRARPLLKSDLKGKFVEIKVRAYVNYQYKPWTRIPKLQHQNYIIILIFVTTDDEVATDSDTSEEKAVEIGKDGQVYCTSNKTYQFDSAFEGDAEQQTVYNTSCAPLVQKFIFECQNSR